MAERKHSVCPWWLGYLLASPVRRLRQNPTRILQAYVHSGMTVLEPGPGMGFFTLDLARLVGSDGRVVAVDVQSKMIAGLRRRAAKAGLLDRIDTRVADGVSLGLSDLEKNVDFVLAFAVVHEMPSPEWFFREVSPPMKPGARLLLAEPNGHVNAPAFEDELSAAAGEGLSVATRPAIAGSRAALLRKE